MLIACNKPKWISSFDVVKIIRTHFQDKVGHSGTLDPMATGLMILWVGKWTKRLTSLIGLDKSYETVIDFSLLTDTWDASFWDYEERFELTEDKRGLIKDWKLINAPELSQISAFLDSILWQEGKEIMLPLPTFSAKKQNGKRMYKDARKGKAEVQERPMKIYDYEIIDYTFPLLRVKFSVGSGTYIRSIGYWLGQQLGLGGALVELERMSLGSRSLSQIWTDFLAQWNIKGERRLVYYCELDS